MSETTAATESSREPEAAETEANWGWGLTLALIAPALYAFSTGCLRAAANCDPTLVSFMKVAPAMGVAAVWTLSHLRRSESLWNVENSLGGFLILSLVMQVAGNWLFQWSLGEVGIALASPLSLGTLVVGAVLLGRFCLAEPITPRNFAAVTLLVVATILLSFATPSGLPANASGNTQPPSAFWGIAAAAFSGILFAIQSAAIRRELALGMSLPAVLSIVSLAGSFGFGVLAFGRLGWSGLAQVSASDWGFMLLAGGFNAVGFVAATRALQLTSVGLVNSLNATQAAIAATLGIVFFGEALSGWLIAGMLLTLGGVSLLGGRDKTEEGPASRDATTPDEPALLPFPRDDSPKTPRRAA